MKNLFKYLEIVAFIALLLAVTVMVIVRYQNMDRPEVDTFYKYLYVWIPCGLVGCVSLLYLGCRNS